MRRSRGRVLAAAIAAWILAAAVGCSPTGTTVEPTGTTVVRLDGTPRTMLVAGPDGMRGRADFGGADGMLFDHGRAVDPTGIAWVMDGVPIALDIAWFDATGRYIGGTTMAPCPAEPCPQHRPEVPYRWAIEAPVGALAGLDPSTTLAIGP